MSMDFLHFLSKELNFGLSSVPFLSKAGVRNHICEELSEGLRVLLFIEELPSFVKAHREKDTLYKIILNHHGE